MLSLTSSEHLEKGNYLIRKYVILVLIPCIILVKFKTCEYSGYICLAERVSPFYRW